MKHTYMIVKLNRNINFILFLIVKKRKVDDDAEPSTSKGLPTKMQSKYMRHLT